MFEGIKQYFKMPKKETYESIKVILLRLIICFLLLENLFAEAGHIFSILWLAFILLECAHTVFYKCKTKNSHK